jgi:Kef-type K+ transport system membrane component KefB
VTPLGTPDIAHILVALTTLLVTAHIGGSVFARLRQPRAIGELVGGLVAGPTVLGVLAPSVESWVFQDTGPSPEVLSAVAQLGLLLLVFVAGSELRTAFVRSERLTVTAVFVTGMTLPFAAGVAIASGINHHQFWGPRANTTSFVLVFSIAMAITSIPVISRIMHDLGIIDTSFGRIVLGVAVLEDLVLYVVLAIAIGYAGARGGALFGLPGALGMTAGTSADLVYHVAATMAFVVAFLRFGPAAYRRLGSLPMNAVKRSSPVGHHMAFMLSSTALGLALGIEAFFGAFLAGIVVAATEPEPSDATLAIRGFSVAFFIPVYFASVGAGLDLIHDFNPLFFAAFACVACAVKALSVYAGARAARQDNLSSWNLAVALNARGGPGIVVASTALAAQIINEEFYVCLVLLAVLTSLAAGAWLERVPRERLIQPVPEPSGRATVRGGLDFPGSGSDS